VRDHDPAPARVAIAVADPVARPSLPAAGPVATLLDPLPGVDASANAALAIAIDPDPRVRRVAIASLEPAGAIDPLTLALDDPQPEVRERALIALARLRTPAALGLIDQARSDDDPDVRALAEDLGRGLAPQR
jgi:HEAT repeat protein